ncbi:hypothetical protein PYW07_009277 [Mythimna separata]|uniref:Uncharacterized protein n=1 Tax=Mythimna separata TaxID=271217 RepID=A0AAD8DN27_MYTSE|nr:hypothetical protein PYW07_009277 [Mythimna separata]
MNGGRSDASTSTDDVKSRPLCLFYFTHPFGVLSAEPPTLAAAPPHIARAFLNMQPVPPWTLWSPAPPAPPPPPRAPPAPAASDDDYRSSSASRPGYELGAATVHRSPLSLVSVTRARRCTLDFGDSRSSISSSLFSADMWFNAGAACRGPEYPRRLVPYNRILPPLQLPSPKDSSTLSSSDDFWPKKCLNPEKFSLPPIELPSVKVNAVRGNKCSTSSEEAWCAEGAGGAAGAGGARRGRRRLGVSKPRRARAADLRRLLAARMRRALAAGGGGMGYLLERCPAVDGCCGLSLRRAALLAGALGLAWGLLYVWLFSAAGAALVARGAGAGGAAAALRYAHGALGVLLLALHALLLAAALADSDALCDLYIWGTPVCWAGLLLAAVTFAGAAVLRDQLAVATLVLFAVLLSVLVSAYFMMVVINFRLTMP